MVIRVAGCTALAESQISISPLFQTLVADKVGLMTFAAVYGFMLARQFVAGCTVTEFILVKTHNIKIAAMVIAVAGDAFFSFRLSGCMESNSPVDPQFYFLMATQAFVIRNFVAQYMAFGTVVYPLQIGMRLRQIARRYLRTHPACKEDEKQGDM